MATFDDSARVRWTIAALKALYEEAFREKGIEWEIVVIDNHHQDGEGYENHSRHLRLFNEGSTPPVRVIPFDVRGTFPPKAHVFEVARGDVVIVIDCHVIPRGIDKALEWLDANPDFNGLFSGPLLTDQGTTLATHQEREYRDNMLACWQNYHGPDAALPMNAGDWIEGTATVPQQGAFLFGCRKRDWPADKIPQNLRGFGGDENLWALFRSLGRQAIVMEWLACWHDFMRMGELHGQKADARPSLMSDRFRNDVLWFQATGETHRIVEAIEHYTSDRVCHWSTAKKGDAPLPMSEAISILRELGLHDETGLHRADISQTKPVAERSGPVRFTNAIRRA